MKDFFLTLMVGRVVSIDTISDEAFGSHLGKNSKNYSCFDVFGKRREQQVLRNLN